MKPKIKKIRVHFMGLGGSGMTAVALLAKAAGYEVSGCDLSSSNYYVKTLLKKGIKLKIGHKADHLKNVDILTVSPAIFDLNLNHPEVVEAKKRKILMTWQEFMGRFLQKGKFVIAIAGTHGKSTTTALMGLVLEKAGFDPSVEVGAIIPRWSKNVRIGSSKYFVCEADEFYYNFLNYSPSLAIINNIEMDHPEFFRDFEQFKEAFKKFIKKIKGPKILVVNEESQGIRQLLIKMQKWLRKNKVKTIGYYFENRFRFPFYKEYQGSITRTTSRFTYFEVMHNGINHNFKLKIAGSHNVYNALGVIGAARELNIGLNKIKKIFQSFNGLKRRFEMIGNIKGIKIFDDYGHHPTAIAATLDAVKNRFVKSRIWAIIEPHQISRLRLFMNEFASALNKADKVIITKTFLGREKNVKPINPLNLVKRIGINKAEYIEDFNQITGKIAKKAKKGDVVVVFGAGKSYLLSRQIKEKLKNL